MKLPDAGMKLYSCTLLKHMGN